ncbi:MAG: Gfo/Idh/MocA family oxidoreductase [Anaerolineae bacterium]
MAQNIRWGILGTGSIAQQFAQGVQSATGAELVAVGSRTQESADAFGARFGVPRCYPTYEALVSDPTVDVIYVSTPHILHKENALLCLNAGKPVLCEKPFTINAADTREVVAQARAHGLFLMEAMWTRFLPAMVKIRELLREGILGEVRMLWADFGFYAEFNPKSRLYDLALGGGSLLDVGIYPVSFAAMVMGQQPSQITSTAQVGSSGVDEHASVLFNYSGGQSAMLASAISVQTPTRATIAGEKGFIDIQAPFFRPSTFTVSLHNHEPRTYHYPFRGNGYNYEAEEVGRCLHAGLLESTIMPLDETLAIMETMDAIRAQWGLKYPGEA